MKDIDNFIKNRNSLRTLESTLGPFIYKDPVYTNNETAFLDPFRGYGRKASITIMIYLMYYHKVKRLVKIQGRGLPRFVIGNHYYLVGL